MRLWLLLLAIAISGCVVADEEEVGEDESALKQGSLAEIGYAPAPDVASVTETVVRNVKAGVKPAIYLSGGKAKGKPRAVLAVDLLFTVEERIHLLANVAISRCNKDDITGNGGPTSACKSMKSNWGAGGYPYQPKLKAWFQLSDGNGTTKPVGTPDTFTCSEAAHHCPLELAADVVPDPDLPLVELVVEADDPSGQAKPGDLVEVELDDPKSGRSKSTLHVFRIGRDAGAPGLVEMPKASTTCIKNKIEIKTSTTANGSSTVFSQTFHVNPATTYVEVAAFAEVFELKNGFYIEPLLNSQLVMTSSTGRTELSPRGGLNCTAGRCSVSRYGSLRVKPGFFGDEDITVTYDLGAVRTQQNHGGHPITGSHFVRPKRCGMAIQTLRQ